MIVIGIPLGVGTTLLADKIILLIFGQGYLNSIIALQILIWTIVFTFAGAGFARVLEATNKQLILTKISGICMIINIFINLILIPRYGLIGASIATVLTEIVLVMGIFKVSYNYGFRIRTKKVFKDLLKIIIASLIMSIIILYLKDWNLLILSFISILVYLSSLYALKGIDKEDIIIIRQIFKINL